MTPQDLQSYRKSLSLNVRQFAEFLGVTPPCISQWLSGKYKIPTLAINLINALKTIEELRQPKLPMPILPGKCACGCGGDTKKAWRTDRQKRWVKGQYLAFINGHNLNTKSR